MSQEIDGYSKPAKWKNVNHNECRCPREKAFEPKPSGIINEYDEQIYTSFRCKAVYGSTGYDECRECMTRFWY